MYGLMKIDRTTGIPGNRCAGQSAFTLIEVVLSTAIAALVLAGMFQGYNMVGRRVQFSACNLAASATAMRQLEQVVSANWIPTYGITQQLFSTPLLTPQTGNLCLPSAKGNVLTCTNLTTISQISTTPPYTMIQVQCVWSFPTYGGIFTNTVAVLRAPNL